jgi:hypothetical protein
VEDGFIFFRERFRLGPLKDTGAADGACRAVPDPSIGEKKTMSTRVKRNQASQTAADQSLIDGFTKHAATLLTLLVGGSTVKTSDLVTVLQARIAVIKAAIAAKAALMAAVAAMNAEMAKTAVLVSGARQALKVAFAGQADQLGDFGLQPPKVRTPPSAEAKAQAAAKALATRQANHPNAGKKSKVTPVAAAPAAAPVAPAEAPSAPAAPAAPGGGAGTPKS